MSNVTVKSSIQKIIVHSPDSISVVSAGPVGPGGPGVDVPVTSVDGRIGDVELDDLYDAAGSAASVATAAATALSTETTNRGAADTALASAITMEASDRASADTALSNAISSEASTRSSADSALDTRIDALEGSSTGDDLAAEIAAREAADSDLASDISDEAAARASGDSTLSASLITEINARASGDSTNAAAISAEATARASADTAISGDVTAEATARATADTALSTALSTETTDRTTADNAADARLDLLETAPPAHHTSHEHGGSDELSLAQSQVVGLIAALAAKATPADISTAINNLVGGSPGLLDTLKELADAIGDDPNFAATMTAALAGKQAASAELTTLAGQTSTATGRSIMVAANAAAIQIILGLVPGTDIQAHSTVLDNTTAAFTTALKTKLDLLQNLTADPFWTGKDQGTLAIFDGANVVPSFQGAAPAGEGTLFLSWFDSVDNAGWNTLDSAIATGMGNLAGFKGDLIAGLGGNVVGAISVGANETVLTANSAAADGTGLSWKNPRADYTNTFLLMGV